MKRALQNFRRNNRGGSLVEYCLVVALIAISSTAGVSQVGEIGSHVFFKASAEYGSGGTKISKNGGGSECTHKPCEIDIFKPIDKGPGPTNDDSDHPELPRP